MQIRTLLGSRRSLMKRPSQRLRQPGHDYDRDAREGDKRIAPAQVPDNGRLMARHLTKASGLNGAVSRLWRLSVR